MLKSPEPAPAVFPLPETLTAPPQSPRKTPEMTSTELERWSRVKQRLRAEVGDDIFSSWFARMDLDGLDDDVVRLSVPTRFLKSWIQAHYAERVDRKSTRLNSSHLVISYAVFCLKKKRLKLKIPAIGD